MIKGLNFYLRCTLYFLMKVTRRNKIWSLAVWWHVSCGYTYLGRFPESKIQPQKKKKKEKKKKEVAWRSREGRSQTEWATLIIASRPQVSITLLQIGLFPSAYPIKKNYKTVRSCHYKMKFPLYLILNYKNKKSLPTTLQSWWDGSAVKVLVLKPDDPSSTFKTQSVDREDQLHKVVLWSLWKPWHAHAY